MGEWFIIFSANEDKLLTDKSKLKVFICKIAENTLNLKKTYI